MQASNLVHRGVRGTTVHLLRSYCNGLRQTFSRGPTRQLAVFAVGRHRVPAWASRRRKRLLTSVVGDATPERGGRKKRQYELTNEGKAALARVHAVEKAMWEGVPSFTMKGGTI